MITRRIYPDSMLDFVVFPLSKAEPSVFTSARGMQVMLKELYRYVPNPVCVVLQVVQDDSYDTEACRLQLVACGENKLAVLQKAIIPADVEPMVVRACCLSQDVRDAVMHGDPEGVLTISLAVDNCAFIVEHAFACGKGTFTVEPKFVLMGAASQPAVYLDPGCVYPRTPLTIFYDACEMGGAGAGCVLHALEAEVDGLRAEYRDRLDMLWDVLNRIKLLGEKSNEAYKNYRTIVQDVCELYGSRERVDVKSSILEEEKERLRRGLQRLSCMSDSCDEIQSVVNLALGRGI